mmetsp:Transcript_23112/g.46135  ORF Transcript_23112/g.46135 Transcript_23112/m.46135 type:complete len:98 (-) Transcript_23112:65-358(-)
MSRGRQQQTHWTCHDLRSIIPKKRPQFFHPRTPGTYDTIAHNATNAARAQAKADNNTLINNIESAQIVALLCKNQIIAAVKETYVNKLNNPDEGFLH